MLIAIVKYPERGVPPQAAATFQVLADTLTDVGERIAKLDAEISQRAKENEVARRLMTIPGIGP